ncbi:tRNA lysidine(34) synthetase TilS [Tolypothrix campylonemoides VB511288]|nr:tRNA lysidine(34) synthetase TilS [Tolypothrix campylonemoides VB511288]
MTDAPRLLPPPMDDAALSSVAVAYSGGLDSTVLLHLLRDRPGVRALHVHHGLHPDADAWAAYCEATCAGWGVPLTVLRVRVARDAGDGLEGAARRARYAAFETVLQPGDVLALAHHRDDQAETFMLRALRGSGVDGLGAMAPWRAFGAAWLWRPLLDTPRAAIARYADAHGLRWVEDPSNTDAALDRNHLRHAVLPALRARWPEADAAFARAAALAREAATLLDAEDDAEIARLSIDANTLSRDGLRALPAARRARVLRRWIARLGLPPLPASGVEAIDAELLDARDDAEAAFRWREAEVLAWRDALWAGTSRPPLPSHWRAAWDGRAPLALPGGGSLALLGASGFDAPLSVHARRGGERIRLPGRAQSHALKHVLQAQAVPPWRRSRMPLLSDADGVLCAAGDRILSGAFAAWLDARRARLCWSDAPR